MQSDADHITKAQFVAAFEKLEQQLQAGFAEIERMFQKTVAAWTWIVGIVLGGLTIATAIILSVG